MIALAYKETDPGSVPLTVWDPVVEKFEKGLVFIGLLGIQDPLRPESAQVVQKMRNSGIIVRMVTGDSLETAVYISRQCNILPSEANEVELRESVMEGRTFSNLVGGLVPETNEDGKITGYNVGDLD